MSVHTEVVQIELAIRTLLYQEHKLVLNRPFSTPNVHTIRTVEQKELIRLMYATELMNAYINARNIHIQNIKNRLANPEFNSNWTVTSHSLITTTETSTPKVILDSQIIGISGLTYYPTEYELRYSGSVYGPTIQDIPAKTMTYYPQENSPQWERIEYTLTTEEATVQDYVYVKCVIMNPSDEYVVSLIPPTHRLPRDDVEEWKADITDLQAINWYVKKDLEPRSLHYRTITEEYPGYNEDGTSKVSPYFYYPDTSLRINPETGTLNLWDNELEEFVSGPAREPSTDPVDPDTMNFDLLKYDLRYYPVTHFTNNWSSMVTSESHNTILRSNVDISVSIVKSGISPNEIYYYLVTLFNRVANFRVKNTTITPVATVDNKPRYVEFFLLREDYINLSGSKLLAQLRASILEDLNRVFLVH